MAVSAKKSEGAFASETGRGGRAVSAADRTLEADSSVGFEITWKWDASVPAECPKVCCGVTAQAISVGVACVAVERTVLTGTV